MSGALAGRSVLVTRPLDRAEPLEAALRAEGAEVIVHPMIEVAPPVDPGPLEEAARSLDRWSWLAFTSVYGVRALAGVTVGAGAPRIACVGEATATAALEAGWSPDVVPGEPTADALAAAMLEAMGAEAAGARVLFPCAEDARETLPARLRSSGVLVDEVVAYRKVVPSSGRERLAGRLADGEIDVLTFTSPSTARNFVQSYGGAAAVGCRVVVIGPTTAAAVRDLGLPDPVVARDASVEGLVQAAIAAFQHADRNVDHGRDE